MALRITTFGCVVMLSLFIPLYSFLFLPPFDFLPFNRGVNVLENIRKESAESIDKITFIYKNKVSGKSQEFTVNDTTWRDTSSLWEYVDTKIPETRQEVNHLSKFVVMDADGNDFASTVFDDSDYNFIIIARNIEDLLDVDFQRIAPLYKLCGDGAINLYFFTSSDLDKTNEILSSHGLSTISTYNVDEVVLKSMIRNDRGVMLVSDGVIRGKWNLKQNYFKELDNKKLSALVADGKITIIKYTLFLLSLVVVLFLSVKKIELRTKKGGKAKEIN